MEVSFLFIISAFFAGILTFLAPCTLPLVPAYLGFVSGVEKRDLENPKTASRARKKIFRNSVFFVLGFTGVFTVFGILVGLLGSQLAEFQIWLARLAGFFVVLFGLVLLGLPGLSFLRKERRLHIEKRFEKGKLASSFFIGAAFAVGWTPCIGPVLGSILLLAGSSSTAFQGGFLLLIFSVGLALPFLLVSFFFARATKYIQNITPYLGGVSIVGGLFLIFIGVLLMTDQFTLVIQYGFSMLDFLGYQNILEYL